MPSKDFTRFGPFTYPRLGDRAVARAAVASAQALRTAPRRCRREPRDATPCATGETSRLASARTPRMVPPSPHAGPGAVTPHHGSIWGNNKENAAGVTPGPMAYGTTPGAKTNAESVAEVRRRPDTSFTRVSAPISRRQARRRPRLARPMTPAASAFPRPPRPRSRPHTRRRATAASLVAIPPSATRIEESAPSGSADPSRPLLTPRLPSAPPIARGTEHAETRNVATVSLPSPSVASEREQRVERMKA